MNTAMAHAWRLGLFTGKPQGAADATGLSADGRSSYYAQRQIARRRTAKKPRKTRKTKRYALTKWPKINAVIHTQSHLILAACITEGPSHDSPELPGLLRQTTKRVALDCLLADPGYDAEAHHRLARQELHMRSTVIALNPRNQGRKWPKTRYRRQMKRRFHRHVFGQRWQVESVWSRHKRKLGWVLSAKSDATQAYECHTRIMTHNLMLLAYG